MNEKDCVINATRFVRELRRAVYAYASDLQDDKYWVLFKKKMKRIVKNCEP